MLFNQWAGLLHRVEHFNYHAHVTHFEQEITHDHTPHKANHSCILFDATSLAHTLFGEPTPLFLSPCYNDAPIAQKLKIWFVPFTPYFLSRAPPFVN